MSIFRVEKSSNYTVISNYHLRDKNLSLRTIGLLSLILSLPDTWDYSQAGLAAICKDGEDSIRSGLKELEKYGYLERERERDESGRMRGIIYHIYEIPKNKRDEIGTTACHEPQKNTSKTDNRRNSKSPKTNSPKLENPILVKPVGDFQIIEFPKQVNEKQRIKDIENKDIENKEVLNIYPTINQSDEKVDRLEHNEECRENWKKILLDNIGYEFFEFKHTTLELKMERGEIGIEEYDSEMLTYDLKAINRVVEYMLDIILSLNTDPIKIGDELINREVVRSKLKKVGIQEMKQTVYELNTNPEIRNPKKYAISMLYNA